MRDGELNNTLSKGRFKSVRCSLAALDSGDGLIHRASCQGCKVAQGESMTRTIIITLVLLLAVVALTIEYIKGDW